MATAGDENEMPAENVFIGIGSNLGDSVSIVRDAIRCLGKMSKSELVKFSSLYVSEPVGDVSQNDFVNAVAALKTSLQPTDLLLELQAIESAFYRKRDAALRWGPRTLDLDIILYGNRIINDSHLTVPHGEMQNRLFVLKPLREILGDIYIPGLGSLDYLIDKAPVIRIDLVND
jgi:2-amino-4-hydroxy-6-hydroxymethyldihydropteridine diphosphokinase